MRSKILRALAGAASLAVMATAAPAVSYLPLVNSSASICGISTVFAPGSVSISTVYLTSLPDSPISFHEIKPSSTIVTVSASSTSVSTIYETVPISYGGNERETTTVYVTVPASPVASGSIEAIGVTPSTISETLQLTSTLHLNLPPTTTRTSTRHNTVTVSSSNIVTETLTSSESPALPTAYAVGSGSVSSAGSSESLQFIETVYTTATITISTCGSEVTNCPYATKPVTLTTILPVSSVASSTNAASLSVIIPEETTSLEVSTILSTSVITITSCPAEVTECPFTTAPVTHTLTSTVHVTNLVTLTSCVPGVSSCPNGGTKGTQPSTTSSVDAVRQTGVSSSASSNGYIPYYVTSGTTVWLGQTPDAAQSWVYATSVITVVPVYTTPYKTTESNTSSLETTQAGSSPSDAESTSTLTLHSTRIVTATATKSISVGTSSIHTAGATEGWNSTSRSESGTSTADNSPLSTSKSAPYPISNVTSTVGPTATETSSSSIDIYHHTQSISASSLAAQSGFLHGSSSSCTEEVASSAAALETTLASLTARQSTPLHYVPYPTLNATSSAGPTGAVSSSYSSPEASATSDNSPIETSSSSSESVRSTLVYVPYPASNTTSPSGTAGSIPSSSTLIASPTSDNSPVETSLSSSAESSSKPVYYVPYPTANTTSTVPAASSSSSVTPSTASDNSPIGTTSSYVSNTTTSSSAAISSAPSSFLTLLSSLSADTTGTPSITSSSLYYSPSLAYSSAAASSFPSNSTLSSSTSQTSPATSGNSPSGASSTTSVYSSISSTLLSSTITSSTSPASATPTVCGEHGDFTLNFDDIPPLSVSNGTDPNSVSPEPVFNPYHQFDFSDGFAVVPPPTDPYLPSSGKLLLEFIPEFNINGTNPKAGPNTDELGTSGGISDGDHGLTGCFTFNFYGASFGCDSKGPDCDFTFSGYRLNENGSDVVQVTAQDVSIPACPALSQCNLTPITVDDTFQDLVSVRINVTVGGAPKIWWMDDLNLGWFNNSCTTGLCRQTTHLH